MRFCINHYYSDKPCLCRLSFECAGAKRTACSFDVDDTKAGIAFFGGWVACFLVPTGALGKLIERLDYQEEYNRRDD